MTNLQRLQIEQSEAREALNNLLGTPSEERTEEQSAELTKLSDRLKAMEPEIRAAILANPDESETETTETDTDAESRERQELRAKVTLSGHIAAAMEERELEGAELEYNQALGLRSRGAFPLELLAPEHEERATTDVDSAANQRRWLDRLFFGTAAAQLGLTFESVPAGVASYPITLTGPESGQLGRGSAAPDQAWTVGVTELKPTRNAVRLVFSEEDTLRLPGLEDALRRDLTMGMTEKIDLLIFKSGQDAGKAVITGLETADINEVTLKQADKVKGPGTLAVFAGLVDGLHSSGLGDLRIVSSVGVNKLWLSTLFNQAVENQTIAQFLRASGISWGVRGGIAADTAANSFGAFIAGGRGLPGAGVVPVWASGMMIRDPYTKAASGEIALTLSFFWNLGFPRPSSFNRLKFVA